MVGFVDNTAGQTNNFKKNNVTPEALIYQMTKDMQIWSDLLWISGGLLELDKCLYHLIYYVFLEDGTLVMSSKQLGPKLQAKYKDTNKMIDIKYKNPYTQHKILGHFKAPDGKGVKQFVVLKKLHIDMQ
eukprot:14591821-Ditylum_brightwellii.AAC.1